MKRHIVEGGCTQNPFGFRGKFPRRKPPKQDAERLIARGDRFWYVAGWPWRTLRHVLRKARPS